MPATGDRRSGDALVEGPEFDALVEAEEGDCLVVL